MQKPNRTMLKKNIIANLVGNGWAALMSLVFIPLYIKFMGMEAYGLVGFFATLQAVFFIMDMGLSATVNREIARLSVNQKNNKDMHELVLTLQVIYWIIAIFICILTVVLSPLIANYWLKTTNFSPDETRYIIALMGIVIMIRLPLSFYFGGLAGLQKQVLMNGIKIITETFRWGGSAIALWIIAPTIQVFFTWQIIANILSAIILHRYLWQSLPYTSAEIRFSFKQLHRTWRFAIGISGISITVSILMQMDKIILSKLLTLKEFGYYALANTAAMGLYQLVNPVFSALYPRFIQLIESQDQNGLKALYHKGCQFMSVLVLPATVVAAFFSKEILSLWIQDVSVVEHTYRIFSLLIIGVALNSLMNIPYAIQLAYGWTNLALYTNMVAIVVLAPLLFLLVVKYGAIGAAIAWIILNLGYIFIQLPIMHKYLLKSELWGWYIGDVSIPLAGTTFSLILLRWMFNPILSITNLVFLYLVILGVGIISVPIIRTTSLNSIKNIYARR